MPDNHVYRIIQVAGSSENSIEDAIQNAVGRASRTLRQVGWFEVLETRGHVEDGKVAHYQVTVKIGVHPRRRLARRHRRHRVQARGPSP
jgi:dodecin